MNELPPVSCMCLTYGRPAYIVEESIECFLKQDYEGEKELIVLNDFDKQTYVFEHPQVKIINIPQRFKTVGEKRNAAASLCSHDILFVWDDDDVFLPHRISYTIQQMQEHKRYENFFKPARALTLNDNVISGPKGNLFHSGGAWSRKFFDEVGGYPHMGSGQDWGLEVKFEKSDKFEKKNYNKIPIEEIYYIYRWSGTGTFHLSGFGQDKKNKETGNKKVEEYIQRKIEKGEVPTGEIFLKPHWSVDYLQMVTDYIKITLKNKA